MTEFETPPGPTSRSSSSGVTLPVRDRLLHVSTRAVFVAAVVLLVVSWTVLFVGWLLPWEHYADSPADTTSGWNVDPLDAGWTLGGWLIFWLVVGVASVALGLVLFNGGREGSALLAIGVPALLWGLIALYSSNHERVLASDRSSPDYILRANGGVYVAIVGSGLLLITGLVIVVAALTTRWIWRSSRSSGA